MKKDMENWWWEEVEAFIRRHPELKAIYSVAVFITTSIGLLGTWFGWFGISPSTYFLMVSLNIIMAAIVYIVTGIASMRAKKYRRLLDILRELVTIQRRNYFVENADHQITITKDGDAKISRAAQICTTGAPVYWEQLWVGVTPGTDGVHRFEDLNFSIVRTESRVPLKNIVISDDEHRKQVVVLFDPPVTRWKSTKFTVQYCWPKAWKQLLREGSDYGMISVSTRTNHLKLTITVPEKYFIQHFHITPEVGDICINSSKSSVTWKVDNPMRADYRYEVHCTKALDSE